MQPPANKIRGDRIAVIVIGDLRDGVRSRAQSSFVVVLMVLNVGIAPARWTSLDLSPCNHAAR